MATYKTPGVHWRRTRVRHNFIDPLPKRRWKRTVCEDTNRGEGGVK